MKWRNIKPGLWPNVSHNSHWCLTIDFIIKIEKCFFTEIKPPKFAFKVFYQGFICASAIVNIQKIMIDLCSLFKYFRFHLIVLQRAGRILHLESWIRCKIKKLEKGITLKWFDCNSNHVLNWIAIIMPWMKHDDHLIFFKFGEEEYTMGIKGVILNFSLLDTVISQINC